MSARKAKRDIDISPEIARLRAVVGALSIAKAPPEAVEAARAELAVALFEDRIERLVADAPPLTAEQRARLAALIGGGS